MHKINASVIILMSLIYYSKVKPELCKRNMAVWRNRGKKTN